MSFNKLFISLLTIPILRLDYNSVTEEPVSISGYVEMADLYDEIPFHVSLTNPHPYAYLYLIVTVDDVEEINGRYLSTSFNTRSFSISGFTDFNQTKNVTVRLNYYSNTGIEDTVANFEIYSPGNQTYTSTLRNNYTLKSSRPSTIYFDAKGSNYTITDTYESTTFSGTQAIYQKNRFIDFSKFKINITSHKEVIVDSVEFRFYCRFLNSDLQYNSTKGYTSLYLPVRKTAYNSYQVENEFIYYIDKNTGMIYESKTETCDEDPMQFFIPLSLGFNKPLDYEVVVNDINANYDDLIYKGSIQLSDEAFDIRNINFMNEKYHYESLDTYLEGVTYEYA